MKEELERAKAEAKEALARWRAAEARVRDLHVTVARLESEERDRIEAERLETIVRMRTEGHSFKAIGTTLGISGSRVSQILEQADRRARRKIMRAEAEAREEHLARMTPEDRAEELRRREIQLARARYARYADVEFVADFSVEPFIVLPVGLDVTGFQDHTKAGERYKTYFDTATGTLHECAFYDYLSGVFGSLVSKLGSRQE